MCADLCYELPEDVLRLTTLMSSVGNESDDNVSTVLEQYERLGYPPFQLERMIYRYVFFHLPACSAYRFLWTYIPPIIFLLGSFGNILAFLVLRHPSTRYVSAFVYLTVRSVVDEVVLTVGLLRRWIDYLINNKLENTSSVFCKVAQFAGVSSSFLSVWLTVTLTAERALVVSFPLHGTRLITYSRVRKLICTLTLICILLSVHFFITVDLVPNTTTANKHVPPDAQTFTKNINKTELLNNVSRPISQSNQPVYQCNFKPKYAALTWLWTTLDAVIYCYLPFSLIFGLNIVIVYHVNAAQKQQHRIRARNSRFPMQQLGKSLNVSGEQVNNIRQMTIMLLVVSFAFLVTTVAIVVTKILSQVLNLSGSGRTHERLYFQVADTVAELLMYVNHAMNFYLFCATGKRFRSRLWLLLAKCRTSVPTRYTADLQQTVRVEHDVHYPSCSNILQKENVSRVISSSSSIRQQTDSSRNEFIQTITCNPPCARCQSAPPYGRSVTYTTAAPLSSTNNHAYLSSTKLPFNSMYLTPLTNRNVAKNSESRRPRSPFTRSRKTHCEGRSLPESRMCATADSGPKNWISCLRQRR